MSDQAAVPFSEWAIVDLLGHQRFVGMLDEGPGGLLRLQVLRADGQGFARTKLIGSAAIYSIEFVSEATAKEFARANEPAPISRWDLKEFVKKLAMGQPQGAERGYDRENLEQDDDAEDSEDDEDERD